MGPELFALGNVSTLVIAICSVIGIVGGLIGACLHFKVPKRVKEVSVLGKCLIIKQFTPPDSGKDLSVIKEDNILPQILVRGTTV